MSTLETIWSHLIWTDKAVIAANIFLVGLFFVTRRRKKKANSGD